MLDILKHSLWTQFGASIDSLKNAIEMWPQEYWYTDTRFFGSGLTAFVVA